MFNLFDRFNNLFRKYCFDLYCWNRRRKLPKNFKIIPLGKYCFPRVIATINKLKPTKKMGEKSCPFDLGFFYDIDEIIKLIDTKFSNFYEDLEFNKENQYVNKSINAWFNHEYSLTRDEFIDRYNKRIENLFSYFADKSIHKFILIASFEEIPNESFENLKSSLTKYMDENEFSIIFVNQSQVKNSYSAKDIYVINQNHNVEKFEYMNRKSRWAIELRKRKIKEANDIYSEVTVEMLDIIENCLLNK